MTEPATELDEPTDEAENIRHRLDQLERENQETRKLAEKRIILSELKVEAIRAGMIDLDGLAFLDLTKVQLGEDGCLDAGKDMIKVLKRSKPWLFSTPSSSSVANVPISRQARQKVVSEMSEDEYRIARANILKRSTL